MDAALLSAGWGAGAGDAYSCVVCLSRLTVARASLSRRGTVPTPHRDTSIIWALIAFLPRGGGHGGFFVVRVVIT